MASLIGKKITDRGFVIASRLEHLSKEQSVMFEEISKLIDEISEGWTGETSDAFKKCAKNMNSDICKFSEFLEDFSITLRNVSNCIFEDDQANAERIYSKYSKT